MQWLAVSIVLSVVLTVILNVALRLFPGAGRRVARGMDNFAARASQETGRSDRRVRVWTPWKAMLIGSLILTIVVNLFIRLA